MITEQLQFNFFNTIKQNGDELKQSLRKTNKQCTRILDIFKLMGRPLTPDDVHRLYVKNFNEAPITSIRRGITDLTNRGWLEKTNLQKPGRYGVNNFCWKLI